jgi:hypothetical protein
MRQFFKVISGDTFTWGKRVPNLKQAAFIWAACLLPQSEVLKGGR